MPMLAIGPTCSVGTVRLTKPVSKFASRNSASPLRLYARNTLLVAASYASLSVFRSVAFVDGREEDAVDEAEAQDLHQVE